MCLHNLFVGIKSEVKTDKNPFCWIEIIRNVIFEPYQQLKLRITMLKKEIDFRDGALITFKFV